MQEVNFWSDINKAQEITQSAKSIKDKLDNFHNLEIRTEEVQILIEMSLEEDDSSSYKDIKNELKSIEDEIENLNIETLLSGEYDRNDAILELHTDDEAGIKNVTIKVTGDFAYGYLKSEKGVHRLVRISPYNSSGKRQTSFAGCEVLPELTENQDIEIKPEDLRIDTYRSSGSGGQHVNTTDSAVRITHIPTNIIVQCQNERSQHTNKEYALKMLKAKLIDIKIREHKDKIEDITGEVKDNAWGSQIRSYVFHPYNLVKDHRTGAETANVGSVMDGNIDIFINEYLKEIKE